MTNAGSPGAPAPRPSAAALDAAIEAFLAARRADHWDAPDHQGSDHTDMAAALRAAYAVDFPVSLGAPTPAMIAALCAGVPQWHEVDQGGEVFGWKVPDERGCYQVVPAPRTIEHYTAAVLEALRAALTAQEETS